MARFASSCLENFGKLTKQMEVGLGPDTGDLGLRIGKPAMDTSVIYLQMKLKSFRHSLMVMSNILVYSMFV